MFIMEERKLYQKYSAGRHWGKHPTIYAESFSEFLKENNFEGLIVDVGCGNGRDVKVFSKLGFNADIFTKRSIPLRLFFSFV